MKGCLTLAGWFVAAAVVTTFAGHSKGSEVGFHTGFDDSKQFDLRGVKAAQFPDPFTGSISTVTSLPADLEPTRGVMAAVSQDGGMGGGNCLAGCGAYRLECPLALHARDAAGGERASGHGGALSRSLLFHARDA